MTSTNTNPAPADNTIAEPPPVFVDDSGRRARNMKRTGWIASILCAAFLGIVGVGLAVENVAPPAGLPLAVPAPVKAAPVVATTKATQQQAAPRRQIAPAPVVPPTTCTNKNGKTGTDSCSTSTAPSTQTPPTTSTSTQPPASAPVTPPAAGNGTPTNGTPTTGTPGNGTPTNGTPTNGTATGGTQPATPNTQGQ